MRIHCVKAKRDGGIFVVISCSVLVVLSLLFGCLKGLFAKDVVWNFQASSRLHYNHLFHRKSLHFEVQE
jgi:hypothetical protein